jgi:large subunit ribosomal protein L3
MPGHMGNRYRVLRGLKIWRINTKYNVMWVQGSAIAGETNGVVYVFDSMLPTRRSSQPPPTPTFYEDNPDLEENLWAEDIQNFKIGTIQFKEE